MTRSTRNPWLIPGALAGTATALAVMLFWPRPEISSTDPAPTGLSKPKRNGDLCLACERAKCAEVANICFPPEAGSMVGSAEHPPPDPALGEACRAVLECVRETGCGKDEPAMCFCGEGADLDACESGSAEAAPRGACKDVIQRYAGTGDPRVVSERFGDHKYGTGLAMSLHTFCDRNICKEVCR
jgi:hypothetical protein